MAIEHIESNNFEEIINGEKPVLIDFFATWCGPCKMLSPIIEQLAEETDKVVIAKCDIDQCEEIARKYNIMSIPTLVAFKNGKEISRAVGFRQKTQLLEMIDDISK